MVNTDFIGIYDNALSSSLCEDIIEWTNLQPLTKGLSMNSKGITSYDSSIKDSWDFSSRFSNQNPIDLKIFQVLNEYTPSYRESYPEIDLIDRWVVYDNYNIQKYDPGDGYYSLHCENAGGRSDITRVLAWMIYLNTVTDKGGTYFSSYNKTLEAKEGRLVIWPAYFTHHHKGVVSKTQTKYIATGWYNFVNLDEVFE